MYIWVKVVHVLAIISWMAGLLYLPRLFVYHAISDRGSVQSETFKVMERRLLKAIMTPAMIVAWITGSVLIWKGGFIADNWLQAKIAFVIALTASHFHMGCIVQAFAQDANTRAQRYFRILNEVPTLLMIGIVILVIAKPF